MKRILSILLCGACCLCALTACSGGTGDDPATDPGGGTQPVTDPAGTLPGTNAPESATDAPVIPATDPPTEAPTEPVTEPETEPLPDEVDRGLPVIEGPASLARLSEGAQTASVTVSDTPNPRLFDAFGCEWDPHFFRSFNVESGCTEEAWTTIVTRIRELGLQKVRMMILPGWYEPQNDNDDPNVIEPDGFRFDSGDFASVLRYLDVCEEEGIRVNLTVWGVNRGVPLTMDWLAYDSCGDWISAPTDKDEFAENVSALLSYLLDTKGYTCVRELTLYNEPDWAYKGAGGAVSYADYEQLCRRVNARLVSDGLRDRVKLILSDDTDTSGSRSVSGNGWYANCLANLTDIADGFDTHVYAFRFGSKYTLMQGWASARNKLFDESAPGLQYTHNEFGSNLAEGAYGQTDSDTFERGLFLSQMAEATLNAGSQGMLYWVLHDVRYNNYPNRNDSMMRLGLFRYADEGWAVRPAYYAWGLIMKHTVPGSSVFPVTRSGDLSAAALRSPEGAWTYLCTNPTTEPVVLTIDNPSASGLAPDVYLYAGDTLPDGDTLPEAIGTAWSRGGKTYVYLPAKAFAVLTTK